MMSSFYRYVVVVMCLNIWTPGGNTKKVTLSDERYNFFDAELLQVLFESKENLLVSPVSIKLVLGMLMEGAEGETAEEIRTALRLPDDDHTARKEFETWLSSLQVKNSSTSIQIANQMFLSDQTPINENYTTSLNKHYSAGVTSVKFQNSKESSKIINNWVSNQTNQLIPSIVEENQINQDSKMMLTSAIYFKGVWATPFATERTMIRCFYPKDNHCENAVMMMVTGYFDYGFISRLDAEAIQLPYKDGKYSMMIILPSKKSGIEQLSRDLIHVNLKSIQSELNRQEVVVQIPQFEIGYNIDMIESLRRLHVSKVFSGNANLSRITNSTSFVVNHLLHSARITVNEEGSEAAAATGALFVPLMGGTTTKFIANHPFVFFITHTTKNSILFAGKVYAPESSSLPKDTIKTSNCHKNSNNRCKVPQSSEGPKFRSIKAPYSRTVSLKKKETVSNEQSLGHKQIRKNTLYPVNYIPVYGQSSLHADRNKKRRKLETQQTRHPKKEEGDDMRRHVLVFS